jgi:hypothetical protein
MECVTIQGEYSNGKYAGSASIGAKNTLGYSMDVELIDETADLISSNTALGGAHEHTTVLGSQTNAHVLKTVGPEISCATATLSGTTESGVMDEGIILTPSYEGCKDSLGRTVHIYNLGCEYRLRPTESTGEGNFSGDMNIECPFKFLTLSAEFTNSEGKAVCEVRIFRQDNLGSVNFSNLTEEVPTDVEVKFTISTLSYEVINQVPEGCGVAGGIYEGGTYKGGITLTGRTPAEEPTDLALVAP